MYKVYILQYMALLQFLRLRRLCSDDKDFETKCLEMRTFLSNVATLYKISSHKRVSTTTADRIA